jgi:hypothetical protein
MDAKSPEPLETSPLSSEEVTASHGPWFSKGDRDDYEVDRQWPTVPRVDGLAKRLFPLTIDVTLLVYVGIVVGAVLILT